MARILDFTDGFESSVAPAASGVAASTIINTPSGNLVATDVQSALNELQSDIDTRVPKVTATDNAVTRFDGTTGLVQNSTVTISDAGDVVIPGDLTVSGTTVTLNTATLDIEDANITLNKGGNNTSAQGAGIDVERSGTHGSLKYDSALASKFKIGALASESEVADVSSAQTFTNKTLTTPIISSISNTGTLTLPTSTDTLVGKATTDTFTNKTFDADGTGNSITNIENADIKAAAAIALNKLAATTVSRALVSDASGFVTAATTTATELGYVNGVTSAIQTQLDAKAPKASPTFTGTVTTPLTASRALVTGASSELAVSATTTTELGYVNGVTSAIQTQLNAKMTNPMTAAGDVIYGGASGAPTRLVNGTAGQVLTAAGGTSAPTWTTIITDWVAYTPTITGFGTPSAVSFYSRRVGNDLEIRGKFTSGTSTATEARVTTGFLGTNNNITTSSAIATIEVAGTAATSVAAAVQWVMLVEPNVTYLTFGQGNATGGLTKKNGNTYLSSGDTISFRATVPSAGWP